MTIKDIIRKIDLYEVEDPEYQLSAEEFNTVVDSIKEKFGCIHFSEEDNLYFIFASEEDRDEYLADPQANPDLLMGAFEAPAPYSAEITLISDQDNTILLSDTDNRFIEFDFDIVNKNNASTGDGVTCQYTFQNGNIKNTDVAIYAGGTHVKYMIPQQYLKEGINRITIAIVGRNTFAATTVRITYNVINLHVDTTFDFQNPKNPSENMIVAYSATGSGTKYVEWYIDGEKFCDDDHLSYENNNKSIDISSLSAGKHNLQFRAYVSDTQNKYYSNVIYRDFVISGSNKCVLISTERPTGEDPTTPLVFKAEQYEQMKFDWAVYSNGLKANVTFKLDDLIIGSYQAYEKTIYTFDYTPSQYGEDKRLSIIYDQFDEEYNINIDKSSTGISDAEGYVFNLSAAGRSNEEINPAEWSDNDVTATFSSNFKFQGQSGWNDGALVIQNGASISLNYAPFETNKVNATASQGITIEIDFETDNVLDENAVLCSCLGSNSEGFIVTASSAKLTGSTGVNVETKYKDKERIRLAFIINRHTGNDARFMHIVNNGVLERTIQYTTGDRFIHNTPIVIGGQPNATIKLYQIRVYDRALGIDEAFSNYAANSNNTKAIVTKNDVFSEGSTNIDIDKTAAKIPVMIITDISGQQELSWLMQQANKNLSTYVNIEYINMQDPTKSFNTVKSQIKLQGTSSLNYPRKNFKIYAGKKCDKFYNYLGQEVSSKLYSFKDEAVPVGCWCLKADFAESSGTHNTGIAKLWGNALKNLQVNGSFVGRTPAQVAAQGKGVDIRTTVDGFPIVLFYKDKNNNITCLGQYNFNNDKSTEDVFGFTNVKIGDETIYNATPTTECWECLNNTHEIALFKSTADWNKKVKNDKGEQVDNWTLAFEGRFPDGNTNTARLKSFVDWVVSCKGNQTKFNSEYKTYIDDYKVAAYYVYTLRFGAVDQMVKNTMLTTFDGTKWFFINYDNDTVMGVRNDGILIYDYNITRETLDPDQADDGGHAYAGYESTLWNLLEGCAEFMHTVQIVDQSLYEAGISYENCCRVFDEEQSDKWCERIYNQNGHYKYIEAGNSNYYKLLQGTRKSHRHWWLKNRFNIYDAMWVNGAYKNKFIEFLAPTAPIGSHIVFKSAKAIKYGWGVGNNVYESGVDVAEGESHTFSTESEGSVGDVFKVYGIAGMSEIDLSDFASRMTRISISNCAEDLELKKLVIGKTGATNTGISTIEGIADSSKSNYVSSLEHIDITGMTNIKELDLTGLKNLKTFVAANSGYASFVPANGVVMNTVVLPSSVELIELTNATLSTFTYTPTAKLHTVYLSNTTGIDTKQFVSRWMSVLDADSNSEEKYAEARLYINNVNWTDATVDEVIALKKFGNLDLSGKIKFSSITYNDYQRLVEEYGESCFDPNGKLIFDADPNIYFNLSETLTVGTHDLAGIVFPIQQGRVIEYHMYNSDGIEVTPNSSNVIVYRNVRLDKNTNKLIISAYDEDTTITIQGVCGDLSSERFTRTIAAVKGLSEISLQGLTKDSNGEYNIELKSIGTKSYNVIYNSDLTTTINSLQTDKTTLGLAGDNNTISSYISNNTVVIRFNTIPWETNTTKIILSASDEYNTVQQVINVTLKVIKVTSATLQSNINFTSASSKNVPVTLLPYDYNVTPEVTISLSSASTVYSISKPYSNGQFEITCNSITKPINNNKVVIAVNDNRDGGFTNMYNVSNKVAVSDISISGVSSFNAIMGIGKQDFTFAYTPNNYNVEITDVTVTTNNSKVTTSNISVNGFTLNASGLTSTTTVTVTAKLKADGVDKTITKNITVTYLNATISAVEGKSLEAVDLGLPSGLKWANMNIGADKETDSGLYFQWGSINGHTPNDGYDHSWDTTPWGKTTPPMNILDAEHDAATSIMGSNWRIPDREDFEELCNNTNNYQTTINGVEAFIFRNKKDLDKYIVIPKTNYIANTNLIFNNAGYVWTRNIFESNPDGAGAFFISSYGQTVNLNRYTGVPVRGVSLSSNASFSKIFKVITTNLTNPTITASFRNTTNYGITVNGNNVIVTREDMSVIEENTLIITATDENGIEISTEVFVSNKLTPEITIEGNTEFTAINGVGSSNYTFKYTPDNYNVNVELVSISSSSNEVKITNQTKSGFSLNATNIATNINVTITAVFNVDGITKTITKTINVIYKRVYNEFTVYKDSDWIVPNSNVEVKVGDTVAQYIGDGLWTVPENITDENLDVTAGGVVLGKYGLTQYVNSLTKLIASGEDNDEILTSLFENTTKSVAYSDYNTIFTYDNKYIVKHNFSAMYCGTYIYYNTASSNVEVYINDKLLGYNRITTTRKLLVISELNNYEFKKGDKIEFRGNKNTDSFTFSISGNKPTINTVKLFTPDLSLPSTFLFAKNGTLNKLITPNTPNGGTIVINSVTSSNNVIKTSIVDGNIKLTGTIEEGAIETSNITVNYTVNGYARIYEAEISVEYTEGGFDPANFDSLPGDILCSDKSVIRPVIAEDGYTVESVDLGGKTPIGVCIMPASHADDGMGRWMSLDFMDCANPDSGNGTSRPTMYWGGINIDLESLPNLNTGPNKAGGTTSHPRLGSKTMFNPNYLNNLDAKDGLYYYTTDDNSKCPAPFNADGTINRAYRNGATDDFDGRGNTDKIIEAVTVSWENGTINDSKDAGNYADACCCRRYFTDGTNKGDWYLPAIGELCYLMYNAQLINNVLTKIDKIINTNNTYLWASTEVSSSNAWCLGLTGGYMSSDTKNNSRSVRAFLAY